ncbi:PREDICTED: agamous-like MADS-box protein AGL103 [Tarenaya hassleriana]|uniref:agamous-like MADS-box protein AGL103 n=1 Tax=Tarenaya hassleriana TaxID=28532 RepID=UPI00053C8579|nr:PREDICTED: agamous-like MADS-box protein AGL103 [Tarenaya hassleriana]
MSSSCSSISSSSSSKAQAKRKTGFERRQLTVMKKAQELATLCDVEVAVICYGPDGEIQTWPREMSKVKEVAEKYKKLSSADKGKKNLTLHQFLGKIKKEEDDKKKKMKTGHDLDRYTAEELAVLFDSLDHKSQNLQERRQFLHSQKRMTADLSETKNDQFSVNQETKKPESDLSLVPFEQQAAESVHLQETLTYGSFNSVGHGSGPPHYGNFGPAINQAPTPLACYPNFATNGEWAYNFDFPGTQMGNQMSRNDSMMNMMNIGDYSRFLAPQAYQNHAFQHPSGFIPNNIGFQTPLPQIQTPTPTLQQFDPLSAWNPTPSAVSRMFSRF